MKERKMDIVKFLQESAKFMAADRPDIWSQDEAFSTLVSWYSQLAGTEASGEISSGGFALSKREDDDGIEYEVHRKITQFNIFTGEDDTSVFDWTTGGTLVDIGLEIPDDDD